VDLRMMRDLELMIPLRAYKLIHFEAPHGYDHGKVSNLIFCSYSFSIWVFYINLVQFRVRITWEAPAPPCLRFFV
jgi:hypothetical protein